MKCLNYCSSNYENYRDSYIRSVYYQCTQHNISSIKRIILLELLVAKLLYQLCANSLLFLKCRIHKLMGHNPNRLEYK